MDWHPDLKRDGKLGQVSSDDSRNFEKQIATLQSLYMVGLGFHIQSIIDVVPSIK